MEIFEIIKGIIELIIAIITLVFIACGLRTWKIQLKGENIFKLSLEVVRELKLTLYKINDYRNPFYSAGETAEAFEKNEKDKKFDPMVDTKTAARHAENERWIEMVNQFLSYEDKMLKLMILLNDFNFDIVGNKKLKNYILDIRNKRAKKEFADEDRKYNSTMTKEQRENLKNEYNEISKILYKKSDDEDEWGDELENYFITINNKLRKYIK
jgi:hypothetical protein